MYKGFVGWIINIIVLKCLMYAMSMQSSVSVIEAICYTGYMFVQICLQITVTLTKSILHILIDCLNKSIYFLKKSKLYIDCHVVIFEYVCCDIFSQEYKSINTP